MNTDNEIQLLKRQVRTLQYALGIVLVIVSMVGLLSFQKNNKDVLRVKGLVIEDASGKPFILMGNPLPTHKGRNRTDVSSGIVFIDNKGNDRLYLGEYGKLQIGGELVDRTSSGWGYLLNDTTGDERGGYGFQDDHDAVGLGLDYGGKDGGEAIYLFASNERAYITLNGNVNKGVRDRIVLWHDTPSDLSLLKIGDSRGERAILKAQAGKPQIFYQDEKKVKTFLSKE